METKTTPDKLLSLILLAIQNLKGEFGAGINTVKLNHDHLLVFMIDGTKFDVYVSEYPNSKLEQ